MIMIYYACSGRVNMKEPPASSLPSGSKVMILMLRNRD